MSRNPAAVLRRTAPFLSGGIALLLAGAIIQSPESSFAASLQGLKLWWTLVFPALMPFLMLSEMLNASGFVHAAGVLMEPLIRPLLRLPGSAGWTLALGMTSGFPGGAHSAALLHKQGRLSSEEAGRLASLAHFASPVTILIVIGSAMLHSPAIGYGLLAVHWLAGLAAGITLSRRAQRRDTAPPAAAAPAPPSRGAAAQSGTQRRSSLVRRALAAAAEARARDGRGFGRLLGDSVASAVQNLMLAGGCIIAFSVAAHIAGRLLPQLPGSMRAGLLEVHLGAQALVSTGGALPGGITGPLGLALLSALLGWGGLCSQLLALAALKPASARFLPFAGGRLLHGLYAFLLTLALYRPLMTMRQAALPAFGPAYLPAADDGGGLAIWSYTPALLFALLALLCGLAACSGAALFISRRRRHSR
ncbi:nucleoside recognition protein [Paenibacillus sp. HN-1]|uniref:nucleoside recognition domain-containing protein n=1 Tax=Paenibacillus TaxID=44249 RepID=UPI001CA9B92F|nr:MULTISPECIES: nucleoside recognition domain-containing protein [Paenibacillus]MBY9078443.1 nucleoside recognition protein [Paenibacillus sp. CGMCC 1.18879]MBY9082736.1 nucleoside recognition protein [Paenibacillus sinensis]